MNNKIIGIRLKEKREELGLIQSQVAEMTGIKKNTISNYENSISEPSINNIIKLMLALECDANFLFGIEDNTDSKTYSINSKEISKSKSAADLMNNIESNAKAMNIKGLQRLSDYSDDLIGNPAYISKPAEPDNLIEFVDAADAARLSSKHNLIIPFFENAVSAGVGEEFITDAEQFIRIPQTYKKLHADYAVRISGNSMEPDYKNDDILLVRYQQQLEPGELGIFIVGNKMYFKKLGTGRLISLNTEYDDLIINADFTPVVQGKVISKIENNA